MLVKGSVISDDTVKLYNALFIAITTGERREALSMDLYHVADNGISCF
jgi:hypothetical protein